MKTNFRFTLPLLALAAAAFSGCSDDEDLDKPIVDPNAGKEMISFTSNGGETITRASLDGTRAGFDAATKIVMRIKAEDLHSTAGVNRYTRTSASAAVHTTADDSHNGTNLLAADFQHSDVTISGDNIRYWDDAFGRYSKLSVYAVCIPNKSADGLLPNSILTEGSTKVDATNNPNWFTETTENEKLEWEVPTYNQTTEQPGLSSTLNGVTDGTLESMDLCYSNNIRSEAATTEKGVYRSSYDSGTSTWSQKLTNGQMFWYGKDGKDITTSTETTGKFDQGHLIFKHALTKYTINLTEGEGFDSSIPDDFAFTNSNENVALLSFPTKGTFNVADATWTITTYGGVKNLPETTTTANNGDTKIRTLQALSLPGFDLTTSEDDNALRFTIDYNEYYVTKKQIQTKIQEWATANSKTETSAREFHKFAQGYHYIINITVGKKTIDKITAEIVGWEEVGTQQITPNNDYITLKLEERGSSDKISTYGSGYENKFDIYRAAQSSNDIVTENSGFESFFNWTTGYNVDGKATKNWDGTNNVWSTGWFWPNNKTAYHFRIAGNAVTNNQTPTVTTDADNGDYFTIAAGSIDGTSIKTTKTINGTQVDIPYYDYVWGAPFTDVSVNSKFVYTAATGFNNNITDVDNNANKSQIYHAIGATRETINMMLFHMTCQIFVEVTTSENTATDHVVLNDGTNGTKVQILRFYENGKVLMGTGLETPTGDLKDSKEIYALTFDNSLNPAVAKFSYGMVPQKLDRFESGTDGNSYKVGLCITTPDGNQYYIQDLSKVYATVSENHIKNQYTAGTGSNDGKYLVDRWYPNYQYTYKVKILKTGIQSITAELVDWETVTGDLGNINLEGTY